MLESDEQITTGDWVLVSRDTRTFVRLLDRFSLIQRQSAGTDTIPQLVAANVDTLFIVTSCNDDFNLSRLERYLAIAYAADVLPVIVITKKDMSDEPEYYVEKARTLGKSIPVELVNVHDPISLSCLENWCETGQTVALVGSSGVGKSTLTHALGAEYQKTGSIREDDAKGRHTTTHRSLHMLTNGAVLIDSPGMRGIGVTDIGGAIDQVFVEIAKLSSECRFNNCQHDHEPGCAVKAALDRNEITQRRMNNYKKLMAEQEHNDISVEERRKKEKETAKYHKSVKSKKKSRQKH